MVTFTYGRRSQRTEDPVRSTLGSTDELKIGICTANCAPRSRDTAGEEDDSRYGTVFFSESCVRSLPRLSLLVIGSSIIRRWRRLEALLRTSLVRLSRFLRRWYRTASNHCEDIATACLGREKRYENEKMGPVQNGKTSLKCSQYTLRLSSLVHMLVRIEDFALVPVGLGCYFYLVQDFVRHCGPVVRK